MSRLLVRNGSLGGGPFRGGLGEDAPAAPAADLAKLDERTRLILQRLDEDAKNRRFALAIGAASALFAAVKLGILAFPHLKARVTRT